MKYNVIFAIAAGSFGLALTPTLAAADQTNDNPVAMVTTTNSCSQAVALTGTAHFFTTLTINNNSIHVKVHSNTDNVSGVGLTDGSKYNLVSGSNVEFNLNGVPPFEFLVNVDANLVGQGAAPNLRTQMLVHITVDAAGNTTAEFVKATTVCR